MIKWVHDFFLHKNERDISSGGVMDRLKDKVALITGGSSGIGLATAELFLAEGAQIIVTGRDQQRMEEAQQKLGPASLVVQSEAGNLADIDSLLAQIKGRFGRLDTLVLNAGIVNSGPFDAVDEARFDEVMTVNFKGAFFTIQKALPLMSANSSIVLLTSIVTKVAASFFCPYAASKAALRSMMWTLAPDLVKRGIRLNAVAPGPIDTGGFERMGLSPELVAIKRDEMENRSPIKRFGRPDEVAKVLLFIASDDASYVVGEEIFVDGAITCVP
jgi:NAD(P)-dependent dehydrogenase (short-subunit alcohol dehydrogenase family)